MGATIGITMMPSSREALNRFSPESSSNRCCKKGARTIIPMNPSTTEGKKPRISIIGLKNSLSIGGHTSDKNTASANEMGRAKRAAKSVADSDPTMRASMPNLGGSIAGYQSFPVADRLRSRVSGWANPSFVRKKDKGHDDDAQHGDCGY